MSKSFKKSTKLLQSNVDECDIIVKISSVGNLVEVVDAGKFITFQYHIHSPVEDCFAQLAVTTLEYFMNLNLIQLVPQPISGKNQVFVIVCQGEVSENRGSLNVRTCEDCQSSEVVLFKFQVKVTKRAGGLKPSLHVAGSAASHNIILPREFLKQTCLLEFFACIQAQVCHRCLLLRKKHTFTISSISHMQTIFQHYCSQCARAHSPICLIIQVLFENGKEALLNIIISFSETFLKQFFFRKTKLQVLSNAAIQKIIEMLACILGLSKNICTVRSPPWPSNTDAVNPSIDLSRPQASLSSMGLFALYETVSTKGYSCWCWLLDEQKELERAKTEARAAILFILRRLMQILKEICLYHWDTIRKGIVLKMNEK